MEDPKGGPLTEQTHQVKTMNKAIEWFPLVSCKDLPITVEQKVATNGRIHIKVFDRYGKLIHTKG